MTILLNYDYFKIILNVNTNTIKDKKQRENQLFKLLSSNIPERLTFLTDS